MRINKDIPEAEEIRSEWEKLGSVTSPLSETKYGVYLSPEGRIAQIHEVDGELVCVMDDSGDIIYLDERSMSALLRLLGRT